MKKLLIVIIIAIAAYAGWRWLSNAPAPAPVSNTNTATDLNNNVNRNANTNAPTNTNAVVNANTNVNAAPVVNENTNTNTPANENVNATTNTNVNASINVNNNAPVGELPKKVSGNTTGNYLDGISATFETGDQLVLTVADLKTLMDAETATRYGADGPHFAGSCFNSYSLAPDRKVLIFAVGCEPGDLALPWIGAYDFAAKKAMFVDKDGGHLFAWEAGGKNVTYSAYLGLSGMEEKRRATKNADGSFTVAKAE
jgi:hypothetical protein